MRLHELNISRICTEASYSLLYLDIFHFCSWGPSMSISSSFRTLCNWYYFFFVSRVYFPHIKSVKITCVPTHVRQREWVLTASVVRWYSRLGSQYEIFKAQPASRQLATFVFFRRGLLWYLVSLPFPGLAGFTLHAFKISGLPSADQVFFHSGRHSLLHPLCCLRRRLAIPSFVSFLLRFFLLDRCFEKYQLLYTVSQGRRFRWWSLLISDTLPKHSSSLRTGHLGTS